MRLGAWVRGGVLALCCAWAACSSGGDPPELPSEVTVQVGTKGGRLELGGVSLDIPEGALDKEVKISVHTTKQANTPERTKALSEVYEFGPPGTKFKKDVEVRFKLEREERAAVVFFTREDDPEQFEKLETERQERDYVAKVKHFSAGFVGLDEADAPGSDAGSAAADAAGADLDADAVRPDASQLEASTADAGTGALDAAGLDADDTPDADTNVPDAGAGTPDASSAAHIVIHSRDDVGSAANYTWAAFQDGTGPWQPLLPTTALGTYEIDVKSARYAVAFVCDDAPQLHSRGIVRYAAATTVSVSIDLVMTSACRVGTPQPMHTVYGPLSAPAGNPFYRYGHANISQLNASMGATTLFASAFPGGVLADLIAGVGSSQNAGLSRVMVLRDILINADLQRPFDFVSEGSNVGPTYSVLVSSASDSASIDVYYTTRNELGGMPMRDGPTSTPSASARLLTYASIPVALQRPDDSYRIRAQETVGNFSRMVELRANLASNQSFSLPPTFPASFTVKTGAYLRPGMDFADYPGATRYTLAMGFFPSGEQHGWDVVVDADYFAAPAPHSVVFPDLSGVSGFSPSWVPPGDTTEQVNLGATAETYTQSAQIEQKTSSSQAGSYRVVP